MKRALLVPLVVYIIAKFLNPLGNFKSAGRLMHTSADCDFRRAPVSRIVGYSCKGNTMKVEQMRGTKLKWLTLRIEECFYHFDNCVELLETI